MVKLNESQRRYMVLFEKHVDVETGEIFDKEFERDILTLRSMGADMNVVKRTDEWHSKYKPLYRFMWKYELPPALYSFVYLFALEGTIDPSTIGSTMMIISDKHEEAVGKSDDLKASYNRYVDSRVKYEGGELKLLIGADVTLKQAKEFLEENWNYIQSRQSEYKSMFDTNGTVRPYFNAKRDYRIVALHAEGLKDAEIAKIISNEYGIPLTYKKVWEIRKKLKPKDIPI
jgi:hypothetical protein